MPSDLSWEFENFNIVKKPNLNNSKYIWNQISYKTIISSSVGSTVSIFSKKFAVLHDCDHLETIETSAHLNGIHWNTFACFLKF